MTLLADDLIDDLLDRPRYLNNALCRAFVSWLGLRCTRAQGHAGDHQCGSFSWPHRWPPR